MYRVFVTACAVGALLSLCVGAAFGQAGTIGIFSDKTGTNPYITDGAPGLLTVYVVHVATGRGDGVPVRRRRSRLVSRRRTCRIPIAFPVTIGNSQTGVSIGYGNCRVGTIHVQTISYFASGTTPSCCSYHVLRPRIR